MYDTTPLVAPNSAGMAYAQTAGNSQQLGVAELTDGTVKQLHQAVNMLDTLIERLIGPQPEQTQGILAGPPAMGIRSVAQAGNALAGEVLMRLHRLSSLI